MTDLGRAPGGPDEGTGRPSWRRGGSGPTPPPSQPEEEPALAEQTFVQRPAPGKAATRGPAARGGDTHVLNRSGDPELPHIPGLSLTRELGRGGMGIVYLGTQGYLDRRVAVKVLAHGSQSEEFKLRFQREAKILASLGHPNIVSCYQAGLAPDGRCYLAMEYIDGPTLGDWIGDKGALSCAAAVRVCRELAGALAHAQAAGIIHRDVKPANVLLKSGRSSDDGFAFEPMLADLGLARPSKDATGAAAVASGSLSGLTVQGTVMGSPPTMAPEQFDDPDQVDYRTDIYGLGCVLFHCLTGKLAFPQGTLTKLIARKAEKSPPDPRELCREVPVGLAELVCAMLAPLPEDRPQTYDELLRRLEGPFGASARRRPKALVWGAGALGVALVAWLALGRGSQEPAQDELARAGGGADAPAGAREPVQQPPSDPADGRRPPADPPVPPVRDDPEPGPSAGQDGDSGTARTPEEPRAGTSGDGVARPAADGEPPAPGAGEERRDPEPSAPDPPAFDVRLSPIRPGESWLLLAGESERGRWRATAGDLAGWSPSEDSPNGIDWLLYEGHASAEHELPESPWSCVGTLKMVRPVPGVARALRVVVALASERGVVLEQSQAAEGDALRFSGALVRRAADGGWDVEEPLGALALDETTRRAYEGASFEVRWDGHTLRVAWGAGAARDGAELALEDPDARGLGPPVALAVELDSCVAMLRDFSVRGG